MQETRTFDLDAGVDSLAFANTLDGRLDPQTREQLQHYDDLVAFAHQASLLDEPEASGLRAMAMANPAAAQGVLKQAIALRETIYRIFSAVAAGRAPENRDLAALNHDLCVAMAHSRLVPGPDGIEWDWQRDPLRLDRVLWPVVRSAAELLTSGEEGRVRECAAHDCGWLFLDESRNRTRRWCSMQSCGNRAKVDRFRARRRGAEIIETDE